MNIFLNDYIFDIWKIHWIQGFSCIEHFVVAVSGKKKKIVPPKPYLNSLCDLWVM